MRKWIVLAIALVIALTVAPIALAGNGGGNGDGNGGGNGPGAGQGACTCTGTCAGPNAGPGPSAGHGPQARRGRYALTGTVTAVDSDGSTVNVLVKSANRLARAYRGKEVTLTVTATTKLYRRTADGKLIAITLADVNAGDRVSSVGKLDRTNPAAPVFTALRITVRPLAGTCR